LKENEPLAAAAQQELDAASDGDVPTYVSPVTAWEIGLLTSLGHIRLVTAPLRWFELLFDFPNIRLARLPPEVLIASSFPPGKPPRDPADRILAATARDLGATLITRDRALLDYGKAGHISVVAC
jgi:PIN domain nuclease of toxin-antitoxin system